ncbi:MAG: hypothetical protein QGG40_05300 [Myxococcota bacterium]|nr:hypothetical protein [Myxococcota bacterium]
MYRILPILALTACGLDESVDADVSPDPSLLRDALDASSPEPYLALVDDLETYLPVVEHCPRIVVDGTSEHWEGGCALDEGLRLEGALQLFETDAETWLAADGFTLWDGDRQKLYLDGAIEITREGDLWFLDVAASSCGGPQGDCLDGPLTVDLSWTLYPMTGFPEAYDASVTGVVGDAEDAPISVEGAWSVDVDTCDSEPASGTFSVRQGDLHALELDGANTCDTCADWTVQGLEVARFCQVEL